MFRVNIFSIFNGVADHCQTIDTRLIGHVCCASHSCHYESKSSQIASKCFCPKSIWILLVIRPQVPLDKFFIIILLCCDIMCLNFLFLVKNTGSWLEIGTSISHFVIMEITVVVLCLLQLVAKVLTTGQLQSLMSGRSRDLSFKTPKIE